MIFILASNNTLSKINYHLKGMYCKYIIILIVFVLQMVTWLVYILHICIYKVLRCGCWDDHRKKHARFSNVCEKINSLNKKMKWNSSSYLFFYS